MPFFFLYFDFPDFPKAYFHINWHEITDVDLHLEVSTFVPANQRYGHCIDVEITLCAYWGKDF